LEDAILSRERNGNEFAVFRGRGAARNPANRFGVGGEARIALPTLAPETELIPSRARTVLTANDSPDVGFTYSINPYRGCEHGCSYCYARPTHEFLGYSAGLDFESKIVVKENAPEVLRRELSARRWTPQPVLMSGVTDPYQPVERRLRVTRRCLEVLAELRNPVIIITKSGLVARDFDLLCELAANRAAAVFVSVTTLDARVARAMEPRAATPRARLNTIRLLSRAGIPTGVSLAPVIPALTDHEIPAILAACAKAGARFSFYSPVRLPLAVGLLFQEWLTRHFPDKAAGVLREIRSTHGGKLNDPNFGSRMTGEGPVAERIDRFFREGCRQAGYAEGGPKLSTAAFRRPGGRQGLLFE
jgi:DNA repair photolyase